jgi:hypothetical protein
MTGGNSVRQVRDMRGSRSGCCVVFGHHGSFPEPKRQFAFRWLREKEKASELREAQMYRYVRSTLYAAVASVIVGVVGVIVTWMR